MDQEITSSQFPVVSFQLESWEHSRKGLIAAMRPS